MPNANLQLGTLDVGTVFGGAQSAWVNQLEGYMGDLVNASRLDAGLEPLPSHYDLTQVGRDHSLAMLAGGFFSHTDLRGRTPQQRMAAAGILFDRGDEVIAFSNNTSGVSTADLDDIYAELANGSHPAELAILHDPAWTEMGCGITVASNQRSMYVTLLFIQYPERVIGVQ